eukprot:198699_1
MPLDQVPTDVQIKIISHLPFFEILRNIPVLSTTYKQLTSNESYLWKLINIDTIHIHIERQDYHKNESFTNSRTNPYIYISIDKKISISMCADSTAEQNNNNQLVITTKSSNIYSKLKLLTNISLQSLRIRQAIKPWAQPTRHEAAMKLLYALIFEELNNIINCEYITFESIDSKSDNLQTKIYYKIMKTFRPKTINFALAVMPNIIPDDQCIEVMHIHRNKYYKFNDFCSVLKKLSNLKKLSMSYLFDQYDYGTTVDRVKNIPWPKTLEYWNRAGNIVSNDVLETLKKSVMEKCPNLKEFQNK